MKAKCLIGHEIDHLYLGRCPVCGSIVLTNEPEEATLSHERRTDQSGHPSPGR